MYKFRVFISYARGDPELAEKLSKKLEEAELEPVWDDSIQAGTQFSDEIKGFIANSHIFIPLITDKSRSSSWVHQEIGFAIALKVPVLPIVIGKQDQTDLKGLLASFQHITVDEELSDLIEKLKEIDLKRLVSPPPPRTTDMFDIAEWPEERTERLIKYSDRELQLNHFGMVRQKAAFSSFYIPYNAKSDIWEKLDGEIKRSEYYRYLLGEERRTLGEHIQQKGCRLIMYPTIEDHFGGADAACFRLKKLKEFLESMPDEKVKVVFSESARRNNLTIVGDRFVAESRIPRPQGYRHTIFKFHPPTVYQAIEQFDIEFDKIHDEEKRLGHLNNRSSRQYAIEKVEKLLEEQSSPKTSERV
uniref:TIR domain-containing protein n=1 Tax=Candidatus Kentrum eta TaxID=2126337 RepID=A0A450U703_9GAMM|nr:MAG: TIR domain-containing protein [Candidatus Kentron sp. H]VFJ89095.1 MAG: TIR domain-containing protein [Candidatus Kentron sp. H]VFJ95785.1 MAG: TIR domain-containing protein [Candidatus Kentron sp. H]